jgi:hypothetical protein
VGEEIISLLQDLEDPIVALPCDQNQLNFYQNRVQKFESQSDLIYQISETERKKWEIEPKPYLSKIYEEHKLWKDMEIDIVKFINLFTSPP